MSVCKIPIAEMIAEYRKIIAMDSNVTGIDGVWNRGNSPENSE
jgi:hypothetical protein